MNSIIYWNANWSSYFEAKMAENEAPFLGMIQAPMRKFSQFDLTTFKSRNTQTHLYILSQHLILLVRRGVRIFRRHFYENFYEGSCFIIFPTSRKIVSLHLNFIRQNCIRAPGIQSNFIAMPGNFSGSGQPPSEMSLNETKF